MREPESLETKLNLLSVFFALLLFVIRPKSTDDGYPLNYISSFLGWSYFSVWSISFYPQVFMTCFKADAKGLSSDFVLFNLLGFWCYSIYTVNFYLKPEYADHLVDISDVVFALHAVVVTTIMTFLTFFMGFDREPVSFCGKIIFPASILVMVTSYLYYVVGIGYEEQLTVQNSDFEGGEEKFIKLIGSVKLFVTFIKYSPQVYLNYKRKSTKGMSLHAIDLDFIGSVFSLIQLFIDAYIQSNVYNIIQNPIKLGLACLGLFFDSTYFIQGYILYPEGLEPHERLDSKESTFEDDLAPLIK